MKSLIKFFLEIWWYSVTVAYICDLWFYFLNKKNIYIYNIWITKHCSPTTFVPLDNHISSYLFRKQKNISIMSLFHNILSTSKDTQQQHKIAKESKSNIGWIPKGTNIYISLNVQRNKHPWHWKFCSTVIFVWINWKEKPINHIRIIIHNYTHMLCRCSCSMPVS